VTVEALREHSLLEIPGFLLHGLDIVRGGGGGWGGDAEMAQWIRALTALPEVLSSNPSYHMVALNHLS
jgi:hypothetical protein